MKLVLIFISIIGCASSYRVKFDKMNSETADGKKYFVIARKENLISEKIESGKRIIWDLNKACEGNEKLYEIEVWKGPILIIECR